MELTKPVHVISGQITFQKISDSESGISILFNSLKTEMQPCIEKVEPIHTEARVQYQQLDNLKITISLDVEDKFLTRGSQVDNLQKAMKATEDSLTGSSTTFGVEAQAKVTMNAKIDSVGTELRT